MNATHFQITRYLLGDPPRYQLLGYAAFEQGFPEDIVGLGLELLFQLATDDHPAMCWGDGGYLYFWARPAEIERGDFSAIFTNYQCG